LHYVETAKTSHIKEFFYQLSQLYLQILTKIKGNSDQYKNDLFIFKGESINNSGKLFKIIELFTPLI